MKMTLVKLYILYACMFGLSEQCPLHDAIDVSSRDGGSQIQNSVQDINMDNKTMAQIYHNTSVLLKEIGGGDSLLVQLNQTLSNSSVLALIVKNRDQESTSAKDILKQYRMYYVKLSEEPQGVAGGYKVYWKILVDFVRNQMNAITGALWSPVTVVSKLLRQTAEQHTDHHILATTMNTFTMPMMLKALDLPSNIEKRIIELGYAQEEKIKEAGDKIKEQTDQSIQQIAKQWMMRILGAFRGQLKPIREALIKHGIIISNKGIRISFIGEQKPNGVVDLF